MPVSRSARSRAFRAALAAGCATLVTMPAWAAVPAAHRASATGDAKANPQAIAYQTTFKTAPPKGFEGLDTSVHTLFDLVFEDRKIGAFDAVFQDGRLTFTDPAAVASALGSDVDTGAVTALLGKPLDGNQPFRCKPGQGPNAGCDLLPAGTSGVIVDDQAFLVTLFLDRQYLHLAPRGPRMLGPSTAGPSLIQSVRISTASAGSRTVFGGTFDTLASIGRTAFSSQTTLTDSQGFRAQDAYVQHIWSDRRVAAGLFQNLSSLTLAQYRSVGVEFGSFYDTYLDKADEDSTPLEIVLPRAATVEVYRAGVLIATGRYAAGLQLIDTHNFPTGSYSVRIVARDGNAVLVDQVKTYTKLGNLPPPGKFAFSVRAGERVHDLFATDDGGLTGDGGGSFLPRTTGEFNAAGFVQRRLGRSLAASLQVLSFQSKVYSEASLQLFHGRFQGLVAAGGGSLGAYSGLVNASLNLGWASFNLSARKTHADRTIDTSATDAEYHPYFRSEDTIFGSVQTQALKGSISLSGTYTRSQRLPREYAVSLSYNRSLQVPLLGTALLNASGSVSDVDRRFGISVSFFSQIERRTDLSYTVGADYASRSDPGARHGIAPSVQADLTRTETVGPVDVTGQIGGSTDVDSDRAYAELQAASPYGSLDALGQYQTHAATGGGHGQFLLNGQTGFVIGGGTVQLGLRQAADSYVIVDVDRPRPDPSASGKPDGPSGGYRVTIDDRPADYLRPGSSVAEGAVSLKDYRIGLKAEGAPPYDLDDTQRTVSLYPGNVVRLRFTARQVETLFGQIVDRGGVPVANARIEAGRDVALADDHGYFTITAPLQSVMTVRLPAGGLCVSRAISSFAGEAKPALLHRVGKIGCDGAGHP
jgi:hypothetical protein